MAKNRVAPLEDHSLPRLELLGAVITACLISAVQDALKPLTEINDIVCWADNLAVLCWIRNCKDWKVFVQNRVTEIRKLTSVWKYVSSEDNSADCPTRGMTFAELRDCKNGGSAPCGSAKEKRTGQVNLKVLEKVTQSVCVK